MSPRSIIRRYLLISGLYTLSASVIWGVNTLFLLDAGLNIFQVFIANALFTASMAIFEIPTGVLADTAGRRLSFLISVVVLAIGTLGYVGAAAIDGGLLLFVVMSIVLGLGYTFYSGAVEAWLVDALNAANYGEELDRVFATGAIVSGVAMLIGSLGGGLLGSIDLAIPFLVRVGLLAALFVIAFAVMHDIGFTTHPLSLDTLPAEMGRVARTSITYGWKQPPVRLILIISFIQMGFISWTFGAWQPYLLRLLGREEVWVAGVVAALISLATIAGNSVVEWFTRYCGKRTTLLLWAAGIQTAAAVGVGLVSSFWIALPLLLLMMGTLGVMGPVKQAFLHQTIPSEQRATIVSFDSLVGSGGGFASQTGLGYLSQVRSISAGFVTGGLTTVIVLPLLLALRRLNHPADVIVGTAGERGGCAAQGLPEISAVDTTPRRETTVIT